MSYRQYIGARYVPEFTGAWDATRIYEPLCVADDSNGNSYTSRKIVPAGTPLTNREYWAPSGNYSGAIDTLNRRLAAAENEIEELETKPVYRPDPFADRKFLFISDSFGDAANEWVQIILNRGTLQGENLSVSGIGFTRTAGGSEGNGVLNALQAYAGDKTKITDIVVALGLNDAKYDRYSADEGQKVVNAGQALVDYVNANYNARLHIGYIGNALDNSPVLDGRTARRRNFAAYLYGLIVGKNVVHLANVEYAMCGTVGNFGSDRLHPSVYGSEVIASAITEALTGGFSLLYPEIPSTSSGFQLSIHNGIATLRAAGDIMSAAITINGTTGGLLTTLSNCYFNETLLETMEVQHSSGGTFSKKRVSMEFSGNTVTLYSGEYSGNGYAEITGNFAIRRGTCISFPTWMIN